MIKRMTKRYYRAENIRNRKEYKGLKRLLHYIRFKSAVDIMLKMWEMRFPGVKFPTDKEFNSYGNENLGEFTEGFVVQILDIIVESDFNYEMLMKLANIIYSDSWYMNHVVKQLGADELPKEVFLFDVAGKNVKNEMY